MNLQKRFVAIGRYTDLSASPGISSANHQTSFDRRVQRRTSS